MLDIKELTVEVEDREILHDINLTIRTGETHVLFGPNGSGKTTLIMTIMGFPKYKITKGSILFQGKDITGLTLDERARLGIGMSFQRPPEATASAPIFINIPCLLPDFDLKIADIAGNLLYLTVGQ